MANIEVFDNFGTLDGLMQVIYHSISCFVLISEVGIADWNVELGLVEENQWWKGSWSKEDVISQVEKPVTERNIEDFAEKLKSSIVSGELSIKEWSDSQSKDLQLIIGSEIKIDLQKLPEDESSKRALERLKKIALRAQLQGCRLFRAGVAELASGKGLNQEDALTKIETFEEKEHELEESQKHIRKLENQVSATKQTIVAEREKKRPVVPKTPRGVSRANPMRQKRKIVEAEFESD